MGKVGDTFRSIVKQYCTNAVRTTGADEILCSDWIMMILAVQAAVAVVSRDFTCLVHNILGLSKNQLNYATVMFSKIKFIMRLSCTI